MGFTPILVRECEKGAGLALRCVELLRRGYATGNRDNITFIPHQFGREEAAAFFVEHSKKFGYFSEAPETKTLMSTDSSAPNPLRAYSIPVASGHAETLKISVAAKCGFFEHKTSYSSKGKVNSKITTRWSGFQGEIQGTTYRPYDLGMMKYAGEMWPAALVEEAYQGVDFRTQLLSYDPDKLSGEVEPFKMTHRLIYDEIYQEIMEREERRAIKIIQLKTGCDEVELMDFDVEFRLLKLSAHILPIYVLDYPNQPPRIMAALKNRVKIAGSVPLNTQKCVLASSIALTLISVFFPMVALPGRFALVAVASGAVGVGGKLYLRAKKLWHQKNIQWRNSRNAQYVITDVDRQWQAVTQKKPASSEGRFEQRCSEEKKVKVLDVDYSYYRILGIDLKSTVNEEIIRIHFVEQVKKFHPDVFGSDEQMKRLLKARNEMLKAYRLNRWKEL